MHCSKPALSFYDPVGASEHGHGKTEWFAVRRLAPPSRVRPMRRASTAAIREAQSGAGDQILYRAGETSVPPHRSGTDDRRVC
jgi:hypothetical protein